MDMNVEVAINPNLDISKFGRRLEQALKLSAFKVEEGAKQNIVDNNSWVTGDMFRGVRALPTTRPLTWQVVSEMEYSPYVEFGTVRMRRAKPFLIPALKHEAKNFQKAVEDCIRTLS